MPTWEPIKTRNDGKGKYQSWEAWTSLQTGQLDAAIYGYGASEEEARAELARNLRETIKEMQARSDDLSKMITELEDTPYTRGKAKMSAKIEQTELERRSLDISYPPPTDRMKALAKKIIQARDDRSGALSYIAMRENNARMRTLTDEEQKALSDSGMQIGFWGNPGPRGPNPIEHDEIARALAAIAHLLKEDPIL